MEFRCNRPLLELIAIELKCDYISDLRYMNKYSRIQAARFVNRSIPASAAPLYEWNDALEYIADAPTAHTQNEARDKLLNFLLADEGRC